MLNGSSTSSATVARILVFDYGLFPSQSQISFSYAAKGGARFVVRTGREIIDLNNSEAVWLRRPTAPVAHEEIKDNMIRRAVQTDSSFLKICAIPSIAFGFLRLLRWLAGRS